MKEIEKAISDTGINKCLECGKCTANCPISKFNIRFSPRRFISMTNLGELDRVLNDREIWSCLSCGMCDARCLANIDHLSYIKNIRTIAHRDGKEGICSHSGALQSLMRIMTSSTLKQNRLGWLPEGKKISRTGDLVYFVGCLPYFDVLFSDIRVESLDIAKSTLRILNKLGIEPALLSNERCCGHDLLWTGDIDNFRRLAEHNLSEIEKSKAKTVLFSCAEGYRTFKLDYPEYFGSLGFEVIHISELLKEKLDSGEIKFNKLDRTVAYQDPCRLGRHMGIYDQPREILSSIPGLKLKDMEKSGKNAVCCGTSVWTNCGAPSKMIQLGRLKEADRLRAGTLVTSCPKCYIHFNCALSDEEGKRIKAKVEDLTVIAASAL
ncbi:MAG: (Fe-S)-binding protein [Deltaproteobacteria bacterium]|nr:MAG: (Fe-S)-binding protein [Deltaproteobacteria bacterium]